MTHKASAAAKVEVRHVFTPAPGFSVDDVLPNISADESWTVEVDREANEIRAFKKDSTWQTK